MQKHKKISTKIVLEFQAGQEKAFDEVFDVYSDRFYFMAYNFFKNKSDAEDVVQEIFIKVLQNIKTLKNPEAFHTWVHRLAYNTCLNAMSKKKLEVRGIYDDPKIEEYEDAKASNIVNYAIHKEINEMILEIIQTMPVSLRYATLLRFYEQLSIAEIAEILDISENAVKLRISRARLYIKESLESQGIAPEVINSAMDPKALFLLFITVQSMHKISFAAKTAITTELTLQTGSSLSATTLTIIGTVTTIVLTSGIIIYSSSQKEEPKGSELEPVVIEESHISDISYSKEFTNKAIELNVKTTNENYDYIAINDQNTTMIGNNGTYTVSLVKDNKVTDSKEITIDNIDVDSPVKKSIYREGDIYTISFKDNLSMIDENKIEVYQDNQKITHYQFDVKTQSLQLPIHSQYEYRIIVCDKAGNYTYVTSQTNEI